VECDPLLFIPTRVAKAELERLKKAKVGVRPDGGRQGLVLLLVLLQSLSSSPLSSSSSSSRPPCGCCCCCLPVGLSITSWSSTETPSVRLLALLVVLLLLLLRLLLLLCCVGVTLPRTLGRPPLTASRPCRGIAQGGEDGPEPASEEEEEAEARPLVEEEDRAHGLRMVQGSCVVLGSSWSRLSARL